MRTKGVSLLGVLRAFEALHGASTCAAAIESLPAALREQVRLKAILSGAWYPLGHYREIHAAAQRVSRKGPALARELAREATLDDFRGIYRLLTFVLSPEQMLRKAPSAWSRYYDGGRVEVLEADDHFARVRFSGCEGFDDSLWEDTIGGSLAVLEACGGKDVAARVVSGGRDGDEAMEIETRWQR